MSFGDTDLRGRRGLRTLVGLGIAFLPIYANRIVAVTGIEADFFRGPPSVLLWNWLAVALILLFIVTVERLGPKSIGLRRPSAADLGWAVGFFALATGLSSILTSLVPPAPSGGMDLLLALPLPVLIALIVTTAVTEEVLYRGYPIERLASLTGSLRLATAVSLTLFVAPHLLFFGPHWLLYQGLNVALIYALYLWRRNLPACMLLHGLGNAMILVPVLTG
ncbi:CPBP family intramembrane glutamic endopeptidase [Histidinibacterium lentulum]|uniref:CPBP family intramembrane metalloprotease n=1 Tax=Histidinibacterium lentulum TaxID=2480588 RepID=A0A3N2R9F4_9RHOB|nr:CPBP family intramembrane glutamic endopeptidase [Histidinibacterium lentulum]ROU04102.1 CPBP family intramembrane metalloprotease [Histidinibacterium lentulum]